jgi:hypothetical protein
MALKPTSTANRSMRPLIAAFAFIEFARLGLFLWTHERTLSDFDQLYHAAEYLSVHVNPYTSAKRYWPWPLYYPLPAVLLAFPFTLFPLATARVLWDLSLGGVFAYALWQSRGSFALIAVLSGSYLYAMRWGQTSPLVVAAGLLPVIGGLLVVKPNLGIAMWLAKPNRRAAIAGAAILAISLIFLPSWPADWLGSMQQQHDHFRPPVLRPFGFLLLLAALRWRTPEGRLLLAMALIPQNSQPHDLLPLALIPSNAVEMWIFVAGSWVTLAVTSQVIADLWSASPTWYNAALNDRIWPVVLATTYLPMLWLVIRPRLPELTAIVKRLRGVEARYGRGMKK